MSEKIVQDILLEEEGYLFNDFPLGDKIVDHILINQNGIFVIADKVYKKFLTGDANDEFLYDYKDIKKKKPFDNPIKENEQACFKLSEMLEGNSVYIANIVCFVNDNCDLVNSDNVFNLEELDDLINSFDEVYKLEEVYKIVEVLQANLNK